MGYSVISTHEKFQPKPCPGCNRDRSACWAAPCHYLRSVVISGGAECIKGWAEGGGGQYTPKQNNAIQA